tara:strand:- start:1822 stop:2631 length:810 start_codon:yes stop_codon:yes gene_type:complete
MSATLVTALYDINRENEGDGRKFSEYLSWFKETLKIPTSMVVYVDHSLVDFVSESRKGLPTKIIPQKLDEVPYYFLREDIDKILSSSEYKERIKDPQRLECINSLYNIIIFSKFQWVKRSIEEDHFNSDVFLWLDAGLSRLFYEVPLTDPYPSINALGAFKSNKDKAIIQTSMSYYPDLVNANGCSEEYFWDNRSWVMAGLWGGYKEPMIKFCDLIDDTLQNKMIGGRMINNEQIAMAYVYKNNPELFIAFENTATIHRSYEFIQELSR